MYLFQDDLFFTFSKLLILYSHLNLSLNINLILAAFITQILK